MKKKDLTKAREKSIPELAKIVSELRLKRAQARGNVVAGKEKNIKTSKNIKKDVAQLLTIINQKQKEEKKTKSKTKKS